MHGTIRMAGLAVASMALLVGCGLVDEIVADHTPPVIGISGITSGETIIDPRSVTITVHDADSDLGSVMIYFDGSLIFSESPSGTHSYAKAMTLLTGRENAGHHNLFVRAFDQPSNKSEYGIVYEVFAP